MSINSSNVFVKGTIIEIPLRPRKRMISLRINEDSLVAIDKFVALTGEYSRTLLITKIIEALAEGLKRSDFDSSALELRFHINESKNNSTISIVIPLKSKKHHY